MGVNFEIEESASLLKTIELFNEYIKSKAHDCCSDFTLDVFLPISKLFQAIMNIEPKTIGWFLDAFKRHAVSNAAGIPVSFQSLLQFAFVMFGRIDDIELIHFVMAF